MKDVLNFIITSIVDNPKEIKIKEEESDDVINYEVSVAKEDMGKVIGKNGKIIKAIRNVLRIPAVKQNKKIYISLLENPQE